MLEPLLLTVFVKTSRYIIIPGIAGRKKATTLLLCYVREEDLQNLERRHTWHLPPKLLCVSEPRALCECFARRIHFRFRANHIRVGIND